MNPQEADLILQLKRGDGQAVTKWFGMYHDRLYNVVVRKISHPADAEELVQEIFLNCLKNLNLFRGESSLWTWMCSVARHETADYFRKKYAKKALETLPLTHWLFVEGEKIQDAHEVSRKVTVVLKKMSHEYQELLLMKYVDGKKVRAIAQELNKTIKAIESDLFRARTQFRELWALEPS